MEYKIIRSNRKTMSLEVDRYCKVIVRAPVSMPDQKILQFVSSHEQWISNAISRQKKRIETHLPEPTVAEIELLRAKAKEVLPKKTEYFSRLTGLKYTGVKITSAKTRFGSCNAKNSICYSLYLMQYPEEAIDYVVLHELAHTRHHNHGIKFWQLVEKYMPDYKKRRAMLK